MNALLQQLIRMKEAVQFGQQLCAIVVVSKTGDPNASIR